MSAEPDAGIDKQKLLDEIVGASSHQEPPPPEPPPPPPAPVPAAPPARPAPKPAPVPPAEKIAPSPAGKPPAPAVPVVAVPKPAPRPKPLPPVLRHRNEIAAVLLAFCGAVWGAVGLATREWGPGSVGIGLLAAAMAVWAFQLLRDE